MENNRTPLGRAYIERVGGWRCIYKARVIPRGKLKGWHEVWFIDLRDGKPSLVKAKVDTYRTMEGTIINGR